MKLSLKLLWKKLDLNIQSYASLLRFQNGFKWRKYRANDDGEPSEVLDYQFNQLLAHEITKCLSYFSSVIMVRNKGGVSGFG